MNKTSKINIALVLAVTIVLSTMLAPRVQAAGGTAVEVVPSLLNKDTATPGSTITIEVAVSKVSGMAGYGVVVRFQPGNLSAATVNAGPVFADAVALGSGSFFSDIENGDGMAQATFGFFAPLTFSTQGLKTLFSIDFQVMDTGSSFILLESVCLASLDFTCMPNVSVFNGCFNNDPATSGCESVELSERKAWSEVRKFRISQEADSENTFFAHVTNKASLPQVVRVIFTVIGEGFGPVIFESGFLVLAPGGEGIAQTQPGLGFNAVAAGPGKYFVSAQVFASPDGINPVPGIEQKSFSFQVTT